MYLLHRALEKNETHPKISTLQTMKVLAGSWKAVTKETVNNYSKKAGIKWNQLSLLIQIIHLKNFKKSLLELKSADP